MITTATIELYNVLPQPLAVPPVPRGHQDYPMDAWDLVEFKRCPRRWLLGVAPILKPKVSINEVIRLLALSGQDAILTYAQRPAEFMFTRNECPSCQSVSPAKVCRACGLARRSMTDVRPWNGSSRFCTTWTAEQNKACRRIVPTDIWERALAASLALAHDPATAAFLTSARRQTLLAGTWQDKDTGLNIPLRTVVSAVPSSSGAYEDYIGSLAMATDSSAIGWNHPTMTRSHHVSAALKQFLHNAATGETRATHCWLIVEKAPPHLVARRATSPLLLAAGYSVLSLILAEYAGCLASGIWPSYDSDSLAPSEAFTPIEFEPWMALPPGPGSPANYDAVPENFDA